MTRRHRHDDDDAFDERGILKDGKLMRVPMRFMDSLQRDVRAHFADAAGATITTDATTTVVDAFGASGLALHKPGSRYLHSGERSIDHAVQVTRDAERAAAYAEYKQQTCDAWKSGNDREIEVKPITGDARADAYLANLDHMTNAWRGPRSSGKWPIGSGR
jgi:hypothetical protein